MPTTTCELSGAVYQLDYTKMSSKRGTYYFGKIHSSPVTGFAFTALTAGGHEFDDSREPLRTAGGHCECYQKSRKSIVVPVYHKIETRINRPGFLFGYR